MSPPPRTVNSPANERTLIFETHSSIPTTRRSLPKASAYLFAQLRASRSLPPSHPSSVQTQSFYAPAAAERPGVEQCLYVLSAMIPAIQINSRQFQGKHLLTGYFITPRTTPYLTSSHPVRQVQNSLTKGCGRRLSEKVPIQLLCFQYSLVYKRRM